MDAMGRIKKEELCDSCRKIQLGESGRTVERMLDSEGYKTLMYRMINEMLLTNLQSEGGCSECINLFESATGQ